MGDDSAKCAPAENPHPPAFFDKSGPDGENDRHQTRSLRDHAVSVFELHTADQFRDLVERTERGGPVRDGEASIVAGDQGSGDDQEECPPGQNDGEAVQAAVIG